MKAEGGNKRGKEGLRLELKGGREVGRGIQGAEVKLCLGRAPGKPGRSLKAGEDFQLPSSSPGAFI